MSNNKHDIIKLRRGTAAEWAASEPQPGGEVLKLGEPGYEKDTKKLKIGDGVTPWNSLPYIGGSGDIIINPEDIQDIIGDGFLVAGTGINISYNDGADSLTISTTGVSFSGHTHLSTDISDSTSFGRNILTASSYADMNLLLWEIPIVSGSPPTFTASSGGHYYVPPTLLSYIKFNDPVSGVNGDFYRVSSFDPDIILDIGGVSYNNSGGIDIIRAYSSITALWTTVQLNNHNHTASQIADFNSSVSGLIQVKDIIAGTGIDVSSNSGVYTINSSNAIASDTLEPDGFVNRTDSIISFNDTSREFSISPKSPAANYAIYNNGVKVVKNTTEIITLPDTTALYYIYFNKSNNNLSYKTTSFNFDTDIPVAHIYYNADDNKAVYFGEERHGIRMDASTHRYLHNVFGTQYINGLSISNYTILGNGSNNNDATIAIGNGLIYDEDIEANITHNNTPSNPFEQILYPVAQIPVYYKIGSNGAWTDTTANDFPVKTGTTIQYNLLTGSTWTTENSPNPTNDRYIAYWICATTQENAPIISIMGQRIDSSLEQATSNNSWGGLNLNGLPIVELRPLYRLIYNTKNTLTNSPKGFLVNVLDIRGHVDTVTGLTQNDHGSLYGLADDDHYQYMHIDNSRSINAIHTFNNGFNASGLINATSGNFSSLTVNNTGVSLIGHTHISTNISDSTTFGRNILTAESYAAQNKLGWQIVNSSSITAAPGGQYLIPTDASIPILITFSDPPSPSHGDWYVVIKPSGAGGINGISVGGTTYGAASGVYLYRIYSRDTILISSWKTYTLDKLHNHTSNDITDFNNSVNNIINTSLSTDIVAGTGVSISYDNINDDLIIGLNGFVPVVSLGTLTGSNAINGGMNNAYQTLTLNGTATTLTKSTTGWPTTSSQTTDTVLKITVTSATTITWSIVTDWFNQPPPGALATGTHLFLLRGVGTSVVEGHYIGNKTN